MTTMMKTQAMTRSALIVAGAVMTMMTKKVLLRKTRKGWHVLRALLLPAKPTALCSIALATSAVLAPL
jgi:hypothetical protein